MKRRLQRTALLVSKQEVNSRMNQNLGTLTVDEILGASGTKISTTTCQILKCLSTSSHVECKSEPLHLI